ncbi:4Fe-4S dicluster domain-containing protein [Trueperella bialowiezensis]
MNWQVSNGAGAMSDDVAALLRWMWAHDLPREVVLACDHAKVPRLGRRCQLVVWNGCLTQASVGVPAQILALGIEKVGVVACSEEPEAMAEQTSVWESLTPRLVYRYTETKRGLLPGPEPLVVGQIGVPRRVLLGLGLRDKPPIPIKADETARTLAALKLLSEQGRVRPGEGLEAKLGGVRLAVSECTACGVCVKACPHGALTLLHYDDSSALWQTSEKCAGEQACVELCPVEGLWVQGDMRLADLLDEPERKLYSINSAACVQCGARHPADEGELCGVCQFRKANPFGSAMPTMTGGANVTGATSHAGIQSS